MSENIQVSLTGVLTGVPETMLWPLHYRVAFGARDPSLLRDPLAAELVQRIDYDFEGNFGKGNVGHAIRARYGDDLIRDFRARMGDRAVVVALGEGLETQAWRVNSGLPWISVDVPEAIAVRKQLLPIPEQHKLVSCSALDHAWMDEVPVGSAVFISAAGLLMYFQPQEVAELLTAIAQRFPGAELFFDSIPPAFSKRAMRGLKVTAKYQAPPMPWGISIDDLPAFLQSHQWQPISVMTYAQPYPKYMKLYAFLSKVGPIRKQLAPGLVHARAGAQ